MIEIVTPQIWKLQLNLHAQDRILLYAEGHRFAHELEATTAPWLVDYIRDDRENHGLKTYVWGFIEDRLLVIEKRVPNPGW